MDFTELIAKRRMVRNFTDDPVDPRAIERILDIAQRGPSAGFTQGQDFIVVTDPEMKMKLAELCSEKSYTEKDSTPSSQKHR